MRPKPFNMCQNGAELEHTFDLNPVISPSFTISSDPGESSVCPLPPAPLPQFPVDHLPGFDLSYVTPSKTCEFRSTLRLWEP